MKLHHLKPAPGAHTKRVRLGRGKASGKGKTSGRGQKGTFARNTLPVGFEGGQMPLQRRVPKRGFHNPDRVAYQVVNVGRLADVAAQTVVDRAWLEAHRLVRRRGPVKLLGGGAIQVALTVKVDAVSESAKKSVEERATGTCGSIARRGSSGDESRQ